MKYIGGMYLEEVPQYLIDDHPLEFPQAAKELIKNVGETKGNGKAAELLDNELAIMFRKNYMKQKKKKKI